jgi:hypothetical protein
MATASDALTLSDDWGLLLGEDVADRDRLKLGSEFASVWA